MIKKVVNVIIILAAFILSSNGVNAKNNNDFSQWTEQEYVIRQLAYWNYNRSGCVNSGLIIFKSGEEINYSATEFENDINTILERKTFAIYEYAAAQIGIVEIEVNKTNPCRISFEEIIYVDLNTLKHLMSVKE